MIPMKLQEFSNRFLGIEPVIVGSGTTEFDYQDLIDHDGPICFINDALRVAHYVKRRDQLFFSSLHVDLFMVEASRERPIVICPQNYLPESVHCDSVQFTLIETEEAQLPDTETNSIFCTYNSTLPAIHFLKVAGCDVIRFIGCSPINGKFLSNHDSRLNGLPNPDPEDCYQTILRTCKNLDITPAFV